MTNEDNLDAADEVAAAVEFPGRTSAPQNFHEVADYNRAELGRLTAEGTDQRIELWDKHAEQMHAVISAIDALVSGLTRGTDRIPDWPAANIPDLLKLLEMFAVLRDHLEANELEVLEIARVAGVSWEQLQPVYAPVPAAAAKARFVELAIRQNGMDFFGGYHAPEPKQP